MHAQHEQAAGRRGRLPLSLPSDHTLPRPWDFQTRLFAAGPLSDEELERLVILHLESTRRYVQHTPMPVIAEHVLPEAWKRGA